MTPLLDLRAPELGALAAAVVSAAIVLGPVFGPTAEAGLWGHMVQHLVLIVVTGPLVAVAAWSWSRRHLPRAVAVAGSPPAILVAGAAFVTSLVVWHIPAAFDAAAASGQLHVLEHLSFVATATAMWVTALAARRASARLAAIGVQFAAVVAGGGIGALMTFAPDRLYAAHTHGHHDAGHHDAGHHDAGREAGDAQAGGMSELEDQQLAGLIMWVPGGAAHLGAVLLLVAAVVAPSSAPSAGRRGPDLVDPA